MLPLNIIIHIHVERLFFNPSGGDILRQGMYLRLFCKGDTLDCKTGTQGKGKTMIMTYSLLFLIAVMLFGIFKLVKFGESQDTNTRNDRSC